MNGVNALIARGGYAQPSVMDKYVRARQMVGQERRNILAEQQAQLGMQATRQQMGIREQEAGIQKQKAYLESIAPVIRQINQLPEAQREQAYQQAKPLIREQAEMIGVSTEHIEASNWNQRGADAIEMQVYGQAKGKRRNALLDGRLVPAIEAETGQLLDPATRQPMPGATLAPSRQIMGTPEDFALEGKGARDKEKIRAVNERENLYGVADNVNRIINTINTSPEYVGGTAGTIIAALNSGQMQLKQAAGAQDLLMPGGKFNPAKMGNLSRENINWVRRAAIQGSRVDSAILELAFTHAKLLNNSGKISDADVRFAREIIEGTADKAIKVEKLQDLVRRGHGRYESARKARKGSEMRDYWTEVPLSELLPGAATGSGAVDDPEVDAMVNEIVKDL